MILLTGATGFVGRALVLRLVAEGHAVRCLVRPSRRTPRLPKGVPLQVAVASLEDERGLRSALVGVETVIHVAGAEWQAGALAAEAASTRRLVSAAHEAGVGRVLYLSHLGADRASAYLVLKAKGIAEEFVRQSGVPYTIVRSALLYGAEDMFVNHLARLLRLAPGFFFLPGGGEVTLQPLWVEDLAVCLERCVGEVGVVNQTIALGGPEYLTFNKMMQVLMETIRVKRLLVPVQPAWLRLAARLFDGLWPRSPLASRWLDYLAISRTCETINAPRYFGVRPARFSPQTLAYLRPRRR
jgi:uncharacterized protein YbjT (DUF2867 family)